uniref:Cytochrome P450 n=1 Tax=Daucus carota subsp. sativus TaxID=79200 RepID=A0A162B6N3_DAUCS
MEKSFDKLDKFSESVIQEHLDPSRSSLDHEDLTDVLIALSNDENAPFHLSRDHIKAVFMMAKEVLKVHDTKCCSRPDSYGMRKLSYNQKDISFSPYGDYWREMRKLCVIELFTVKRVRSFQHVRDREIAKLVNDISIEASDPNNKFIHLDEKILTFAKNIICEVAFGTNVGGEKFKENEIKKTLHEAMIVISGFCAADFFPYYGWIIDLLTGFHRKMKKSFDKLDKFSESVIQEHIGPSRSRLDHENLTDVLIALSNDENAPFDLTKDHIKAVFMYIYMCRVSSIANTSSPQE